MYRGIPDINRMQEWEVLGIPFEYNDFMYPSVLDDANEIKRRVELYRSLERDRSEDTIHGPFLDITVHSSDAQVRAVSDKRIRQVCDIATELGVKAIILHTNFIPNFYDEKYRKQWLDMNEAYIKDLLVDYPNLYVYMENMFDEEPDMIVALAKRMQGQRFGICLDIAHANISRTEIEVWMRETEEYVMHYHINDNHGRLDEHLPLGSGNICWDEILPKLKKEASVLIEVRTLEEYNKSIRVEV